MLLLLWLYYYCCSHQSEKLIAYTTQELAVDERKVKSHRIFSVRHQQGNLKYDSVTQM